MPEADRPTGESPTEHFKKLTVEPVETEFIHAEEDAPLPRGVEGDLTSSTNLDEVPDSAQEPDGEAWRTPGTAGDLSSTLGSAHHIENSPRSHDDLLELGIVVMLETGNETKPVAQRTGDETSTSCRTDERETRELEAHRPCRRPLSDDDVDLEILHRGVEDLFDDAIETVNFVDKEDIPREQSGEDRGKIAAAGERRPRRHAKFGPHLRRDDSRERGLPESRRTGEEDVVNRLFAATRCFEDDREVVLQRPLADEFLEPARS